MQRGTLRCGRPWHRRPSPLPASARLFTRQSRRAGRRSVGTLAEGAG